MATKKKATKRVPTIQETKDWFYAQPSLRQRDVYPAPTKKVAKKAVKAAKAVPTEKQLKKKER